MKRIFQKAFCLGFALSMGTILPGFAETIICSKKIEAFDPTNPTQISGYFEAGTSLNVQEFIDSEKKYRVSFKSPDGKEIFALCKSEDLGKNEPVSPQILALTEDPKWPAVFRSLLKLDSNLWNLVS
jgi:hypothetical protein